MPTVPVGAGNNWEPCSFQVGRAGIPQVQLQPPKGAASRPGCSREPRVGESPARLGGVADQGIPEFLGGLGRPLLPFQAQRYLLQLADLSPLPAPIRSLTGVGAELGCCHSPSQCVHRSAVTRQLPVASAPSRLWAWRSRRGS